MTAIPQLELGISNGWILLLAYAVGFLLALAPFSKDDKARLFADPKLKLRGIKRAILHIGQLVAVTFIVIMVLTPITLASGVLVGGVAIYVLGYSMVLISLRYCQESLKMSTNRSLKMSAFR